MSESSPVWFAGVRRPRYAPLDANCDVDVAIVGAGITGLTAAVLLASEGRDVAVIEADRVASGTSGATSAHVTDVPEGGYRSTLKHSDGPARALLDRGRAGLLLISSLAQDIDCDFHRVPGYLFSERADERRMMEEECAAAAKLGRPAELVTALPLPWKVNSGVLYPEQAAMQPVRYLLGLAKRAADQGARIFEDTPVTGFEEQKSGVRITTARGVVHARSVILATHTPIGFNLVQTEVAPYRSYILALKLPQPIGPGLFWDTSDPYFYVRHLDSQGTPIAILGGADHKTGHERAPETRFVQLEGYARGRFGAFTVERRWSSQLYEPADGLPYIGRAPGARRVYLATGFSGVGLVQGTMAAMELGAALRGESTTDAFAATRLSVGGVRRLLSENVDVAARWIGDRLAHSAELADVPPGEGRIVHLDGQRRAVHRDDEGRLHVLSPVCPHMGCIVQWNGSARSWDCPCHGARFAATGERLEGPALSGLQRVAGGAAEVADAASGVQGAARAASASKT